MITRSSMSNDFLESDGFEAKEGRSPAVKIFSILAALAVTAALLVGFLIWRKRHEEIVGTERAAQANPARPALPAKVQVYMDEPVRKGPQAVIGGRVHNISSESLSNVSVEVELTRRKDASTEVRVLGVDPNELAPGQDGRYSLTLTGDYRSIKLLNIKSGPESREIGFKTAPGTPRPVEYPPDQKSIVVGPPSAPKQGEEFINTPDKPARIP